MKKKIITFSLIAVIAAGIGIYSYLSEKIYYNDESVVGNTAGNLYNGGLFCEIDETIYFSNHLDDGKLYSMKSDCTDIKKLSNDKVASINADSHYIYYSRRNYDKENYTVSVLDFHNSGIYRMSRRNGSLALLFDGYNCISCLAGNTIYYQHYDDETAMQFYQVSIDKKDSGRISTDAVIPASVHNGTLYYAGVLYDHYLHSMKLPIGSDNIVSTEPCHMPIAMPSHIYYLSLKDGYHICRMNYDGSGIETLVSEFCFTYNITPDEHYLYYQIDGGNDNRIVELDLYTGISKTIMDGNYKQIHITDCYVFFYDFEGTTVYVYNRANGGLSSFNPPVQ